MRQQQQEKRELLQNSKEVSKGGAVKRDGMQKDACIYTYVQYIYRYKILNVSLCASKYLNIHI